MMNKLRELFDNISDEELTSAIEEIRSSELDGVIKENGVVRKYAKLSGEITGGFTNTDFFMVQVALLKQAAYRTINNERKFTKEEMINAYQEGVIEGCNPDSLNNEAEEWFNKKYEI
jgi:hypothetical protein